MMEYLLDLQLFAGNLNTNTTADNNTSTPPLNDLSPTMKTFYNTSLLENARNEHYFNQFGQKQPLPKNKGNKVEWRKFDTFSKALTPLTEGVTPDGNKVNMTKIEAPIYQYGDYTTISDRLELEAVDPVVVAVTEEHGAQAGDTLDTITRNEVITGTYVIYAPNSANNNAEVTSRSELTAACKMTDTVVDRAFTHLKKMKAPTINGDYIAIIHPSVAYDLRECQGWQNAHVYAAPEEIFNGEIGKLHNVRFVEDTEAKIYKGAALAGGPYTIKTGGVSASTTVPLTQAISADADDPATGKKVTEALVGREVIIGGTHTEITAATAGAAGSATLTVKNAVTASADAPVYPGEAGAGNAAVYGTVFFGKDAWGIIEPSAESLEVIVKQRGSAGSADPLNQRSTVGWKASHAAKILYDERIVRVESGSFYSATDEGN